MKTLTDLFKTFESRDEKTAIVYRTGVRRFTYSYKYLANQSLKMATWLANQGIKKGDNVIIYAPNSPWWAISFWGCLLNGAVAIPQDFASGKDRVVKIVEITKPKLIIQSQYKLDRLDQPSGIKTLFIEDLEHLLGLEMPALIQQPQPTDVAEIIFTSGTTGDPKGVVLTHENLMTNIIQVNEHIKAGSSCNFLSVLPLSHMFEQTTSFFSSLYLGGGMIYLRTVKPSEIAKAFEEEDIYINVCVPRLLQLLKSGVEHEFAQKHLLPLLKALPGLVSPLVRKKFGKNFQFFVSGGSALDSATAMFWNKLGFTIIEGYGLTECSPVLTANLREKQKIGYVGTSVKGVEIKLENGEILAKGKNIFSGYYKNDEATKAVFTKDNWFKTGDLGELDQDGFLKIKGRSKDVIITAAGINVHPDEIETVLNNLDGVKESCVLGVQGPEGEEVHAVLLLNKQETEPEQIITKANAMLDSLQQITSYSVWPKMEFPKTSTLKTQKFLVLKALSQHKAVGEEISNDKLINIIGNVTKKTSKEIQENSKLAIELGLTSIGRLELINYIELEYRMDLDDNMINQYTTVGMLREMIANRAKFKTKTHFRLWAQNSILRKIRKITRWLIVTPIFRHYIKMTVENIDVLNKVESPVIFISNHLSFGDHTCIFMAMPKKWQPLLATAAWEEFFFPQKASLFDKLWRRLFFNFGTVILNLFPLSQIRGFRQSLAFMGKLADRGISILVFPEGERSKTGELLPFKQGIGLIVKELKLPVIPIRVSGIDKVLGRNMTWPKPGTAHVKFGEPIMFGGESPSEIVQLCREAIAELYC